MDKRFKHHPPVDGGTADRHQAARLGADDFLAVIKSASWGPSREVSLATTKLEEALFWLNADIARNQQES